MRRSKSQKNILLAWLQNARMGPEVEEPGKREKRVKIVSASWTAKVKRRRKAGVWEMPVEDLRGLGKKDERVVRVVSWVVGAVEGAGMGDLEEKFVMERRLRTLPMPSAPVDLARMRSPWKATLGGCQV